MDLTLIIVNYNTADLLKDCLNSICKKKWGVSWQIWVVDNGSSDDSVKMVKKNFPQVSIIQSSKNLGFAGGNNLGLKKVTSKYALLLNSDTIIGDQALDNLIEFATEGGYGICSCRLLNQDGTPQPNTGDLPYPLAIFFWLSGLDDLPFFGSLWPSFHKKDIKEGEVGWVAGTAMLISKSVLDKIGLLDEALFMYAEDTDFCLRATKAGFKIGWTKKAQITHLGGGSLKDPSFNQWLGEFRGLIYIYEKYFGALASYLIKMLFYIFIAARMVVFFILGKFRVSKTYAKVLFSI